VSMRDWTIADWTRAIAANNRDKGWREGAPTGIDDAALDAFADAVRSTLSTTAGKRRLLSMFISSQLMLIVSEAAEALEAVRTGNIDAYNDPTSGKPEGLPSELADVAIRNFDLADMLGIDLTRALEEKHSYNLGRAHRHGGKLL
jgi:NTP pyrophosphatase (non-canonical NTP hydrolase)